MKIFHHNKKSNSKTYGRYKKTETQDGDELSAPQTTKQEIRRDEPKAGNLYVSHDIDIYPIANNHAGRIGRISAVNESTAGNESKETGTTQSVSSQLLCQRILKNDIKTEIPNLAKCVRIVVASVHEGRFAVLYSGFSLGDKCRAMRFFLLSFELSVGTNKKSIQFSQ